MTRRRPETPQEAARRGNRMVEALYGDIRRDKGMAVPVAMEEPVRKVRAARKASTEPSEAQILKAILKLLHRHPKVARVWRQNSMTARFYANDGKVRHVRANTAKGMSDIQGILKNGKAIFVEVKSAKGAVMPHQQEFLDSMAAAGAIAIVARSIDDVLGALKDA